MKQEKKTENKITNVEDSYYFPDYEITIKAFSRKEAEKILKNKINKEK